MLSVCDLCAHSQSFHVGGVNVTFDVCLKRLHCLLVHALSPEGCMTS